MDLLLLAAYTKLYGICLLALSLGLVLECAALAIAIHDLIMEFLKRIQTCFNSMDEVFV